MFILKSVRHQLQIVLTLALSLISLTSRIQKGETDVYQGASKARWMILCLVTDYLCVSKIAVTPRRGQHSTGN